MSTISFKFNDHTMDIVMFVARKFNLKPSEAVDKLMYNPDLLMEVKNEIEKRTKERQI